MIIAIIGGGKCSKRMAGLAEEVGRELAQNGAILICGGLGGVMEAACKGAHEAGGQTIGILPGKSAADANPYVGIPIVTGMGEMRNVVIIKSAQAVIAIDGEFGTLSEIGHALKNGIPVIGLHTWELSKEGKAKKEIVIAGNAKEAVEKALKAILKR
ncbi:MAG: TIGR00725 family protein [Dehalococcoidia bacterium]